MAEIQEPVFNSLADRIAALNSQKNFSSPPPAIAKRAPPPPPTKKIPNVVVESVQATPTIPSRPQRREPPPVPPVKSPEPAVATSPALPMRKTPSIPPLPTRKSSSQATPTLPPRRPTHELAIRRDSNSSIVSHVSSISNLSLSRTNTATAESPAARRVLAPSFDQAKLPPLPPSRKEREAHAAKEAAERERAEVIDAPSIYSAGRPGIPRLPSRPATTPSFVQDDDAPPTLPRRLPPPASAYVRPKTVLQGSSRPPPVPTNRPDPSSPPPVPLSSRPSFAQVEAVAVRTTATDQTIGCMICRDFSGPDNVAARYPHQSLPRDDPVGYLAHVLCSPFPSATDKARAIFTWCHHNIAYNVEDFFGKCVKSHSVNETIFMGKAVCQGYAEVYRAIAERAGLECVMVVGHGKGYGYTPLEKGQPPPPKNATGHAWNAVRIDNGEWKLLDACWGAGNVGENKFNKAFNPKMFTLTNERFGESHYPSDDRHFFRQDGRALPWPEYYIGPTGVPKPQWCGNAAEEGLSEYEYSPAARHIPVYSGENVRFQFSKVCEHWTHQKHGKGPPYLLLLKIHGVDGRKEDLVPLETDGKYWWWCDIPSRDLGAPGMKVQLFALTVLNGNDARGVTKDEYFRIKGSGCFSMSWAIWCTWDLV
ncbi:hypothetical protein F5Y18DRAFT_88638 [Xylariaceae sp. FL1019]|nr:hypothetical protein F5Y18DRAFT_88638 [Xylariaceae sp. FL1019]